MPQHFARRVDQQIAYARNSIASAEQLSGNFARAGLVQAAYLQLELALAFYLTELVMRQNAKAKEMAASFVDASQIGSLLERCSETAEGRELGALLAEPSSWLSKFDRQRCSYHRVDRQGSIQGSLFQTHEEAPTPTNLITSVSSESGAERPNLDDIVVCVGALKDLVDRQRVVNEEY